MATSFSFHATQKVTLKKNEMTGTTWYNVYFHMRHYGPEPEIIQEISVFCDSGVTTISPFEEMWQAQEAERLAEEKRINDEENAAHAEIARVETLLSDDTDPVDALEEEHIDASR
ncbi:hypothetical protein [Microcystis phage Mel-JY34]